jgi:hypothetical protein
VTDPLRDAILSRPEWIGWDTVYCYWCDNTQDEGHAPDCLRAALAATPAPAHLGPDDHGHTGRLWCDPCVAHGVMLEQGVHRCATPAPALEVERPRIVVDEGTPLHLVCGVCGRTRDFSDHDHPSMGHGFIPAGPRPGLCGLPPDGWYCTRGAGHPGPCAARAYEEADR